MIELLFACTFASFPQQFHGAAVCLLWFAAGTVLPTSFVRVREVDATLLALRDAAYMPCLLC